MKKPMLFAILTFMLSATLSLGLAQHDHGGEPAFVRVVHASPDAPPVDVFLDGEQTIFGAPFGAVTPWRRSRWGAQGGRHRRGRP